MACNNCVLGYVGKHWWRYLFFIPCAISVFIGIFMLCCATIMFFAMDSNALVFVKWGSVLFFSGLFLSNLPCFKPLMQFSSCHVDSPKGTWATMRNGHVTYQPMGRQEWE